VGSGRERLSGGPGWQRGKETGRWGLGQKIGIFQIFNPFLINIEITIFWPGKNSKRF
jgi:hypothetical protein